jgi:hypothetical protein
MFSSSHVITTHPHMLNVTDIDRSKLELQGSVFKTLRSSKLMEILAFKHQFLGMVYPVHSVADL